MAQQFGSSRMHHLVEATHKFPCVFQFKFVVPTGACDAVRRLVQKANVSTRISTGGRYTALTLRAKMDNADQVVSVYERASAIKGVIAL